MWLATFQPPMRAAGALRVCTQLLPTITAALGHQQLGILGRMAVTGLRHASVKAQGAYKLKNKKTIAKKMGAKRVGDQYVLPGTIIYKQRGTIWHPGENTWLGRDHTIHAAVAGYVKYYRDPQRHPTRQYIGVTFTRDDVLPHSPNKPRVRRLNMVAIPRREAPAIEPISRSGIPRRIIRYGMIKGLPLSPSVMTDDEVPPSTKPDPVAVAAEAAEVAAAAESASGRKTNGAARRWNTYVRVKRANRVLYLRDDYSYSESNVQIGRLMGKHKGKTAGTQRYGSRRKQLRARRRKRDAELQTKYRLRKAGKVGGLDDGGKGKKGKAEKKGSGKKEKKDKKSVRARVAQ